MKADAAYMDGVLFGKMDPISIEFRETFCSYGMDGLEKKALILEYEGRLLDHLTTKSELDFYLNDKKYGRYDVEGIALTLSEFKQRVKPFQEKARKRLEIALKDYEFKERISDDGNTALLVTVNGGSLDMTPIFERDIYCGIRNLANELFREKSDNIKDYISRTKPRK